jgi:hypothetical protein
MLRAQNGLHILPKEAMYRSEVNSRKSDFFSPFSSDAKGDQGSEWTGFGRLKGKSSAKTSSASELDAMFLNHK